jgi:uncharacterized lipoprotein YmbA
MRSRSALLLTLAALVAAGCASKPSRFYTIQASAPPADVAGTSYSVIVGPVTIPAAVDRPEMVVQVAPNQVELLEFDRWASPLGDAIARAVAVDLANLLGTPRVATAPFATFAADYRVTIDLQRFDSTPGDAVQIEAVWVVKQVAQQRARSGRTVVREPANGQGYDALAAAHSRALARVSADIAAEIRAEASAPGR